MRDAHVVKSCHNKLVYVLTSRRRGGDTCTSAALPLTISILVSFLPPGPHQKIMSQKSYSISTQTADQIFQGYTGFTLES